MIIFKRLPKIGFNDKSIDLQFDLENQDDNEQKA
jgi:hypothetical protein